MRLLFAALSLTGCANAGQSSLIAAGAPAAAAASAPFYLEWGTATPAVRVINGFTGRARGRHLSGLSYVGRFRFCFQGYGRSVETPIPCCLS